MNSYNTGGRAKKNVHILYMRGMFDIEIPLLFLHYKTRNTSVKNANTVTPSDLDEIIPNLILNHFKCLDR